MALDATGSMPASAQTLTLLFVSLFLRGRAGHVMVPGVLKQKSWVGVVWALKYGMKGN